MGLAQARPNKKGVERNIAMKIRAETSYVLFILSLLCQTLKIVPIDIDIHVRSNEPVRDNIHTCRYKQNQPRLLPQDLIMLFVLMVELEQLLDF